MPRATVKSNGQAIHDHRKRTGLTQEKLAIACKVTKRTIERLESGETTKPSTILLLAKFFRCSADDLQEAVNAEVDGIRHLLDGEGARAERQRLEREVTRQREEKLQQLIERATLSAVLCAEGERGGVPIRCLTRSKDWQFQVRSGVTLAELANAIAKQYYPDADSSDQEYYFADKLKNGNAYDGSLTVDDLAGKSITTVYLYGRSRHGRPLAVMTSLLPRLMRSVILFRRGAYFYKTIPCRLVAWLYNLSWLSNSSPPRWIINTLNEVALLYAETNTRIDLAVKLANLLERSDKAEGWEYRDSIAWVWYRAGSYQGALATLARELPDQALGHPGVLYHMYFIFKRVKDEETATLVRNRIARMFPELDWHKPTMPDNMASMSLELFFFELECMRVRTDDDTTYPEIKLSAPK
jgi:transcriptional regulator with XRE-family HTH domain